MWLQLLPLPPRMLLRRCALLGASLRTGCRCRFLLCLTDVLRVCRVFLLLFAFLTTFAFLKSKRLSWTKQVISTVTDTRCDRQEVCLVQRRSPRGCSTEKLLLSSMQLESCTSWTQRLHQSRRLSPECPAEIREDARCRHLLTVSRRAHQVFCGRHTCGRRKN